jgi:hypothetical protein
MSDGETQLCNPYSTGGGGAHFEARVQASFVALMLTGGFCPCLPCSPISKIKLQGKVVGYQTDDLIVFIQDSNGRGERKLLAQVKHSISITENDPTFAEVIQSAWRDFNNSAVFTRGRDVIGLITGPLSITDTTDVRTILEWARHVENAAEFFKNVELANFSSEAKRLKLRAFKINLRKANNDNKVSDDEIFDFLRHFHLLGYDLDIKAGVTLTLLHSLIGQYSPDNAQSIWARLVDEVQSANQNAGTISVDSVPEDLLSAFKQRRIETIPEGLAVPSAPKSPKEWSDRGHATALAAAALLGRWYEGSESDIKMIRRLVNGF